MTPKENRRLRKYQGIDTFTCAENACEEAGVELFNALQEFEKDLGAEVVNLPDLYLRLPKLIKARRHLENPDTRLRTEQSFERARLPGVPQ